MRNLVQIVAQAFGELGLTPLAQIVGVASTDAIQTLALLNREGSELADLEGAWPQLRGEQTITLVPAQEAYNFPADILYYRESTGWDRTTHWRVMGPLNDREWQRLRSGTTVASPFVRFRIIGSQIHFDPLPTTTDTIVFEYVSANWCQSSGGVAQSSFLADTDTPLIPDDLFVLGLKWRWLAAKGMNYAEERATYDAAVDRKKARATVSSDLPLGQRGPRFGWLGDGVIADGNWPGR
jgi:hypothetical protein